MTYLFIDAATAVPLLTINDERLLGTPQGPILDVSTWLMEELQRLSQTEFAWEIQGVIVGNGPGSYTGLRIAMAAAKTWCYARDLPLCGVSSLYALAPHRETAGDLMARGYTRIAAVMDARAGGVYLALGKLRALRAKTTPQICWSRPERLSWEQLAHISNQIDAVSCICPSLQEKWELLGLKPVHWHMTEPRLEGLQGAIDQYGIWGTRTDHFKGVTLNYLRGPTLEISSI